MFQLIVLSIVFSKTKFLRHAFPEQTKYLAQSKSSHSITMPCTHHLIV